MAICLSSSLDLLCCRSQNVPCQYSHVKSMRSGLTSVQRIVRLTVRCVVDDAIDPPIRPPQYITYTDINGEPAPARSFHRTPLPDRPFWSPDMPSLARRAQADTPKKSTGSRKVKEKAEKSTPGSRRRASAATSAKKKVQKAQPVQPYEFKEEEDDDEFRDDYVKYEDPKEEEKKEEPKEEKRELKQLPDKQLWYNWRQIPPEEQPWHEWSTPVPDSNSAMATAAAQAGELKLFGEKPSITESTLYRIRRHALKKDRLEKEAKRRKEIGPVAYYSEWVKVWKKDTSKEAVQKHFEETGEDELVQLMNMFAHQTAAEYRHMMGTDPRIQRDPLAMRMTLEQKKAVWGGDPVYPTVNYYQDPEAKIDYRGPNFHEPRVDIWETLEKAGRVISPEKLKQIQEEEAASQLSVERDMEDAIAQAVDIGEKEEEEDKEMQDESDGQEG